MAYFDKENNKITIDNNDWVQVTEMGHITEIQYMEKMNNAATVKKLNKNEFVVLSTGEVKEYSFNENRSQSVNGLRKTFKKLRYLINNNFFGFRNELFLTLTYAENMQDQKRLYDDFRKFIQRLKYNYSDLGNLEYLDVIEPQTRGAWHHHVLIKFTEQKNVFISHKELENIWGHGFIKIARIDNVDNIGAYLTAYLADIALDDIQGDLVSGEIVEKKVRDVTKKFVKGGRLYLYPSGINLYRKSKGIKFPDRKTMKYSKAKELIGEDLKTIESNIFLEIEDYENHLKFEQYNSKKGR